MYNFKEIAENAQVGGKEWYLVYHDALFSRKILNKCSVTGKTVNVYKVVKLLFSFLWGIQPMTLKKKK